MNTLLIDIDGEQRRCWINGDGYWCFKYQNKHWKLHRWLAEKHLPKPEGPVQVNHKDGNKLNNALDNLEWVTHRENLHHAMDMGLHNWGRKAVKAIAPCGFESVYESQAQASQELEIAQSNINKVLKGLRESAGGLRWKYA